MEVIFQTSDLSVTVIWDEITGSYVGILGHYPHCKHVKLSSYTASARWFQKQIAFGQLIEVFRGLDHNK